MTQPTAAQWDSMLADINKFRIKIFENHVLFNEKLDDLGERITTYQRHLRIPVENEASTESGVYDNDEEEVNKDDAPWDRVLTAISKFRNDNREVHATHHKKLDDLSERMTLMEQLLGRPVEHEAPMESCVHDNEDEDDNDNDAPLNRFGAAIHKLLIEIDEMLDIKFKKLDDLVEQLKAIMQL